MNDIRQNMEDVAPTNTTSNPGTQSFAKKEQTTASKGDYIDFEEIK